MRPYSETKKRSVYKKTEAYPSDKTNNEKTVVSNSQYI